MFERTRADTSTADPGRPASGRALAPVLWLLIPILAAVVAAYGNVVFGGGSLLFSNAYNTLDPRFLAENYGPGVEPEELWAERNLKPLANFHDPGAAIWQWEPAARALRRAWLDDGELPWWDPDTGSGTAGLANPTGTPFFPPYLAVVLASDSPAARTAYYLLLQIGAGFALALLLARHGVSRVGSIVGGIAFALSGGMAQNVGSMIGQTLACAPWALLVTSWFLDRPDRRRAAVLALAYAAIALSSFPPMVVAVFFYSGVYALVRLLFDRATGGARARARTALGWAGAALLAAALAAFYLLPVKALSDAAPYVSEIYRAAHTISLPAGNLLQLASPVLLGGQKVLAEPWLEVTKLPQEVAYVGAFVLALAAFAAARASRQRVLLGFALATLGIVVAKALALPPISWLTEIPPLGYVHFVPYFVHSLGLPFAVLAALGWDAIETGAPSRRRVALVLAAATVWICASWILGDQRGALDRPSSGRWLAELAVVAGLLLVVPILAAARGRGALSRRGRVALALGFALLVAEGIRDTWYPRQPRWDLWSHPPPVVQVLQREVGRGRLFAYHTFPANWGSVFGVPQLESLMAFNAPRMHTLFADAMWKKRRLFLNDAERVPLEPFLSRAAVRLVATSARTPWTRPEIERRNYRKIFDDGYHFVYRRRSPPRYFFTSRYSVVTAERARAAAKTDRQIRRLWLEERPGFRSRANRGATPRIEILESSRNRLRLRLRAPRPGLVYLAETQMPGWTATVNDAPTRILAANYAFRAVEVGEGDNVLELVYEPPGLDTGIAVSALALAVIAGMILWPRRERRPQPAR